MFKEVVECMEKLSKPVVEIQGFPIKRPYNLIDTIVGAFDLSTDVDRYMRYIDSDNDIIYVLYKDLIADKDKSILYDVMFFNGKPKLIFVIDYAMMCESIDSDLITTIRLIINHTLSFLQAKVSNMFFTKTNMMVSTFAGARIILPIATILKIAKDTDVLRRELINQMAMIKDEEELGCYIHIIEDNGVERLLDDSLYAAAMNLRDKDKNDEEATV